MTNKTDDMPDWSDVMDEPVLYARDLDGTGSLHVCCKGDEGAIALYMGPQYTRAVDITDEKIKEAYLIISKVSQDPSSYWSDEDNTGEMIEDSLTILRQALSDYGQMVECIMDATHCMHMDSGKVQINLLNWSKKHFHIIDNVIQSSKKCRGQNG